MKPCPVDQSGFCRRHGVVHAGAILELSQRLDEVGEKYRRYWDRYYRRNRWYRRWPRNAWQWILYCYPVRHTRRILRYLIGTYHFVRAGSPSVSPAVYRKRLEICTECDFNISNRCEVCECSLAGENSLRAKLWRATESCPLPNPKWDRAGLIPLPLVGPIYRSPRGMEMRPGSPESFTKESVPPQPRFPHSLNARRS